MSTLTLPPTTQVSREKILNVAEQLFAKDGFNATSLRAITAEAGVNIASVNYYFRSKDQLIVEVLSRIIRPPNEQRIRLLEQAKTKAGSKPVPVPAILEAMIRPCLEMSFDPQHEQACRVLGRSLTEEGNFIKEIIENEWTPVVGRFVEVLKRTLPKVPTEELYWRMHFTHGAVIHTICHHQDLTILSGNRYHIEFKAALRRLINYSAAGLLAGAK
jgi:AcrR family transcriptional regulator